MLVSDWPFLDPAVEVIQHICSCSADHFKRRDTTKCKLFSRVHSLVRIRCPRLEMYTVYIAVTGGPGASKQVHLFVYSFQSRNHRRTASL